MAAGQWKYDRAGSVAGVTIRRGVLPESIRRAEKCQSRHAQQRNVQYRQHYAAKTYLDGHPRSVSVHRNLPYVRAISRCTNNVQIVGDAPEQSTHQSDNKSNSLLLAGGYWRFGAAA